MLLSLIYNYSFNIFYFILGTIVKTNNLKMTTSPQLKPKAQFRHVIYYSLPNSIRFIVKKRLNFVALFFYTLLLILISVL